MRRVLVYILCICFAVMASFASIYLQEKRANHSPVQQPAVSSFAVTPIPVAVPKRPASRVFSPAFPARVAFISNGQLMIVDGNRVEMPPLQVTKDDIFNVNMLGWSHDGLWLMYLRYPAAKKYQGDYCLWVVKADGSGAYQVDAEPVAGTPAWSPVADVIAYTSLDKDNNTCLKKALVGEQLATISDLNATDILDYCWAPDGRSLTFSCCPRTENPPLSIDRIDLYGKRTRLLTLKSAGVEPMVSGVPDGLSWSPDGRYLAYFLFPNSASLAVDGAPIRLLDLLHPAKIRDLGIGLIYKEWLAWSPDSKQLAFITGSGREACTGKQLSIIDLSTSRITDCTSKGEVDAQPLWSGQFPNSLLFCRGPAREWENGDDVLVPGQRIWLRQHDGSLQQVTSSSAATQDVTPVLSSDGKYLFFLRLDSRENGSLFMLPVSGGKEIELISNIDVDVGNHGNYLPASVNIIAGMGRQ